MVERASVLESIGWRIRFLLCYLPVPGSQGTQVFPSLKWKKSFQFGKVVRIRIASIGPDIHVLEIWQFEHNVFHVDCYS